MLCNHWSYEQIGAIFLNIMIDLIWWIIIIDDVDGGVGEICDHDDCVDDDDDDEISRIEKGHSY